MRFLSPLHRLICIFHRLLRMLVPCLVVFFPVVSSSCPVCVRRELVEFSCSLVRVIWHVGLLSMFCTPRGSLHSTLLCRANAWNCKHIAIGRRQFQRGGESAELKQSGNAVGFQGNSLLEKFLGHCLKRNIPPRDHSFRMCTDGKTERYRAAFGRGVRYPSSRRPSFFQLQIRSCLGLYDSERSFSSVPVGILLPGIHRFAFWSYPIFLSRQRTPGLLALFLFVLCRSCPDTFRCGARYLCGPVFSEVVERGETRHPGAGSGPCRSSTTAVYRPTIPGRCNPQVPGRHLQTCGCIGFRRLSPSRVGAVAGEALF
jgi:hypothetical protein